MATNEKTSKRIGGIAAKAMRNPRSVTPKQIQSIAASANAQRPDRKRAKKRGR